jgi:ketosteroid isomerase-like protein
MSQQDVALVIEVFTLAGEPQVEMGHLMRDDAHWDRLKDRFSEDLEVRFVTPGDTGVRVMEQEFQGIEGLREGWGVWMEPWEEFRVVVEDVIDTGTGQVLVIASAVGVMPGTGMELPQEVASLFRLEDGRFVEVGFYLDQDQARRDAGLV